MDHKVLIADDEPQQRRYLSAILSSLDYGVTTADGGIAAVEMLTNARQYGISLALLDLNMPDLDGIKVL
jgi:CheY-like chemotaxis protein